MKKRLQALVLSVILLCVFFSGCGKQTERGDAASLFSAMSSWEGFVRGQVNPGGVPFTVNGEEVRGLPQPAYLSSGMQVMVPLLSVETLFSCDLLVIDENTIRIRKNGDTFFSDRSAGTIAKVFPQSNRIVTDRLRTEEKDGRIYLNAQAVAKALQYFCVWDEEDQVLHLHGTTVSDLPAKYDYREDGRQSGIRDQGESQICWAYAAMTALESSLLPSDPEELDAAHLSTRNSFGIGEEDGGNYSISIAYLLAWQGPKRSGSDETAVHVQGVKVYQDRDLRSIKEAVYRYGGVESSLYFDLDAVDSESPCYNQSEAAYCYQGAEDVNHDVVLIGWDDHYPAANFPGDVSSDGAFICQNSWGSSFGRDGVFYVSYCDSRIAEEAVAYSDIERPDNYGRIYQSDLCGWIGQLGYEEEEAQFANVFSADSAQAVRAVGFYATGPDTEYTVSFVSNFSGTDSFADAVPLVSGKLADAGFQTIVLPKPQTVQTGERFAVMVQIKTPGSGQPVAVEYPAAGIGDVDLTDGEGYLGYEGGQWISTEEEQQCNVCLKAYADPLP